MIGAIVLIAAQGAAPDAGGPPHFLAREATWAELQSTTFDMAYLLPEDLAFSDEGGGVAVDLARSMRRLTSEVYAEKTGSVGAPRCFGDVVALYRAAPNVDAARRVLTQLATTNPALASDLEPWAKELLCDADLWSPKWDPDEDGACDGFVFARPLTLKGRSEKPWKKRGSGDLVQQAALLVRADLEAIKAAENDFPSYPTRPGASFERIGPIEGTFLKAKDPAGLDVFASRLLFETDLPFPFSSFTCDLHVLNRIDDRGRFVCDIYSTSQDVNWLGGRDYYYPVEQSDGTFVAMLIVRLYGFDLRGVPDDDSARRGALRSSLGGLRRDAEAAYRAYGGAPRTLEGAVPSFEIIGKPQR